MPRKAFFWTVLSHGWLIFFIAAAQAAHSTRDHRRFRVVLDPGHGGSDLGATYKLGNKTITEKEITLKLAQEAAIHLRLRGIETILTRARDEDVPLGNRTALANRLKADLFISIHMNSIEVHRSNPQAEGVETYFLNTTSDASSRRLARLENTVLGGTTFDTPQQLDVALILKDLRLDANLRESKRLACATQSLIAHSTAKYSKLPPSARNRGVKQALFHVLLGADMPSILVEAGFITSPIDRSIVLSSVGIAQIGNSLARAVEHYRKTKGTPAALISLNTCKVH